MDKFYLTTPLYYPNARPHVGSAYTTIVCDVVARYKRMCGYDVAFLTGTDEHGEKLQRAAEAAGLAPADFVAEKRQLFIELWKKLGIDYSHFVYTDQPDHATSVQRLIRLAQKNGYIYKSHYQGRYCIHDERYVSDGTEPANCDICGRPAELINEENYFFKLSAFEKPLLELYERHEKDPSQPAFVQPDFRMNEVKSFVKGGLRDISISRRRLKWGIPWPDDPEEVVYVWYDALAGYMTGIGYAQEENGSAEFQKLWPANLHMIGKDILRFHAVYWPAFLLAADLPLPKTIFAHGWIYYEQDKMSKSKGNVVYPEPIVDALDSFGAPGNDALRYYLLRDTPFGQDASFSYEGLIQRYNSDLANDLGNLAQRTITMINRYFDGRLPKPVTGPTNLEIEVLKAESFGGSYQSATTTTTLTGEISAYRSSFDKFHLAPAVLAIWTLISRLNGYLVKEQPWKLAESKSEEDRSLLALTLYTAADLLRTITILLYPLLPHSSERLWEQLGCEGDIRDQRFDDLKWQTLKPGTKVGKPEPIFPRLDKEATLAKLHELAEADNDRDKPKEASKPVESETPKAPESPSSTGFQPVKEDTAKMAESQTPSTQSAAPSASEKISIDDFAKVEMRVGEIIAAEPVPKADKLLKLQVDIGTEVRQVCAGIAQHYQPEQLIGMKVVIVTNLQPRKLRGIESNGMIVAASAGDDGRPVLATFKEDVPKGARLR
ncbi:MAG TPA: methionine--tRNA ligase [Terriglobia bacterium]|nr:methionine--tRNA ligase [Terriglobia bacterium]